MKNSNSMFIVFCLILTVGCVAVYANFAAYFGEHDDTQVRVAQLEKELEKKAIENKVLVYQLKDFQQAVAAAFPRDHQKFASFQQKNLADAVRVPASEGGVDLSAVYMERGKNFFAAKSYDKAIAQFSKIIEAYPLSIYKVEAHFFKAESFYLKGDYEKSLAAIADMVELFPENVLTGFILLRMGQMSQLNEQSVEAREIYKTVLKSFEDPKLKEQAKKLYDGVIL